MRRKEVLVAGKVFDLGADEAIEALDPENGKNVTLDLDVGATVFQVGVSRPDKAVILHWIGMTNIRNILLSFYFYFDFPLAGRAGGIVPEASDTEGEAHPSCEPPVSGMEPPPPPLFLTHRLVPLSYYSEFITPLRGLRVLCVRFLKKILSPRGPRDELHTRRKITSPSSLYALSLHLGQYSYSGILSKPLKCSNSSPHSGQVVICPASCPAQALPNGLLGLPSACGHSRR